MKKYKIDKKNQKMFLYKKEIENVNKKNFDKKIIKVLCFKKMNKTKLGEDNSVSELNF